MYNHAQIHTDKNYTANVLRIMNEIGDMTKVQETFNETHVQERLR